ncbi:UDP-glycosyltransferase 1-like [Hordeum vulgare subsp. vulgare]|uniref:Glycosyltransferase n=2 Tax=Hordeum vulgare subsp. vulgare TaxID=112509 RepID=A0A8I6WQ24_HORVV|nr:UDP-glycosyltransferase 1-like [Hordeum vulgare subsp. vulgare]
MAMPEELHFVLVPLVAQGHIIPMVDVARLLAARGPRVSVVTTPVNAARNRATVDGARRAGLAVEFVELPFPCAQLGLPEGVEAIDQMAGLEPAMYLRFFQAIWKIADPLEEYLRALPRRPVCLVVDACNPWTAPVCERLGIPRLVMHCPSAYFQLAVHRLSAHGVYDRVRDDEMAPFEVPEFPVRAVGNKATFRGFFQYPGVEKEYREALDAEATADGLLFNTSRGIEGVFVDGYAVALGKRTWAVGPTCASSSMVNDADAKAGRGNRADVDAGHIVSWLDARPPASVLYVSFGSISQLTAKQLAELARGIEASGRPFVWAIKEAKGDAAVRALLDDEGFEARVKDRGLLVRGWAPQVTILSHPAVSGFLTHCGWNATLEAVSYGVPTLTWPTVADQFCSEQLLVDVLGVGVRSGVKIPAMYLPKEAEGVQVTSREVEKAVAEMMGDGPEGSARRLRANEIAAEARAAMEESGSSHSDLTDMIRYVTDLSKQRSRERDASSMARPSELGEKNQQDAVLPVQMTQVSI